MEGKLQPLSFHTRSASDDHILTVSPLQPRGHLMHNSNCFVFFFFKKHLLDHTQFSLLREKGICEGKWGLPEKDMATHTNTRINSHLPQADNNGEKAAGDEETRWLPASSISFHRPETTWTERDLHFHTQNNTLYANKLST